MSTLGQRRRRPGPSVRDRVTEFRDGVRLPREDRVVTEEPLELRVGWPGSPAQRVAVTMRTPGHDFELAAGWLVHEGVTVPDEVRAVRYCTDETLGDLEEFNVVTVDLATQPRSLPAARMVSSACGVCGTDTVHDVLSRAEAVPPVSLSVATVLGLPDRLREEQPGFERTGGIHAAGLFEADGTAVVVREDVGRHNAVDKAIGSRILAHAPVPPVLVLSGRIGFELVQKAVVSGVGALVAVGAPTSLAVSLAREADLVLVGFTRGQRFVAYAGAERITD
ncbi:formate dehydrogenase accessory sulfurtransferase FdhD [Nocardioides aurantiacus]|uniref:formate dehydrogenase accessory sulfurtransferase FdhD n=1 Tax=Nocardioides aurantiacus TaxID=86796 RepID=UPI00403F2AD6